MTARASASALLKYSLVACISATLLTGCAPLQPPNAGARDAGGAPLATTDNEAAENAGVDDAAADEEDVSDEDVSDEADDEYQPTEAERAQAKRFPTCAAVEAAVGSSLDALYPNGDDEEISWTKKGPSLSCGWMTQEEGDLDVDVANVGGLGIGIDLDPTYDEAGMREAGLVIDVPNLPAGVYVTRLGGTYAPAEMIDPMGLQVVRGDVVVVVTAGSPFVVTEVPALKAFTQEWGIRAGLRVLELMR